MTNMDDLKEPIFRAISRVVDDKNAADELKEFITIALNSAYARGKWDEVTVEINSMRLDNQKTKQVLLELSSSINKLYLN